MRLAIRLPENWQFRTSTLPSKIAVMALTLIVCGFLLARMWGPFIAAWMTRNQILDPAIYERAIEYDPENADYRFVLAQIYNYSTEHLNLERARETYEAAVRLNPNRSMHWLELARFYEQDGDVERARSAMKKALETDPNYAQTHWAAANLYIRLDDLEAADFELRRAADLEASYVNQVLDLVWRFYEDPQKIMAVHVPNTRKANVTALQYFLRRDSGEGAALAWERLKDFRPDARDVFSYISYLVDQGRPREAHEVFLAGVGEADTPGPVFNHSFEAEPMNGGFDWRLSSSEHAVVRRDTTQARDGMASLLVVFDGTENINFSNLRHWLLVEEAKRYELQFWLKTEGITTDQGVYVEVDGQRSEMRIGSNYWEEFGICFTASSDLVTVWLRRTPSRKLDNLLKGKVWLDAFTLVDLS